MNHPSLLLLFALGCAPGLAALAADVSVPGGEPAASVAEKPSLTPAQLDELLAPIALYPDPLVAIILPASTFPADVVLAARYVSSGGKPESFDAQPWDDSVKALARYPEVLKWMDQNLDWTRQVGLAFLQQPAEVLTGTQRLRAAARAAGNLTDTPEQTVVVERETIRIVPARHEVIYVPVYDPLWVYRPRVVNFYHPGPLIRFSIGYRTGSWLSYHCNWGYNTVVVISRPHRVAAWHHHPKWHCPSPSSVYVHHVWRPSPAHVRTVLREPAHRSPGEVQVSRPTLASHPLRESNRDRPESGSSAAADEAAARPSVANNTTTSPRPGVRASAAPAGQASARSDAALELNRRASASENRSTVSADSPSRVEGDRENRRSQIISSTPAPARPVATTPATPAPSLSPAAPQVDSSPRVSRRIQSSTTERPAGAGVDFRSRPALPSSSVRASAPASPGTAPSVAAPRIERRERPAAPAPSVIERPASSVPRRSSGALPPATMPRREASASTPSPASAPIPATGLIVEGEMPASSRRGR